MLYLKTEDDDDAKLAITKQREFRAHRPIALRFEEQQDDEGRDLGKFPRRVAEAEIAQPKPRAKPKKLGPEDQRAMLLDLVNAIGPATLDDIHDALEKPADWGISTTRSRLKELAGDDGRLIETRQGRNSLFGPKTPPGPTNQEKTA